MKWSRWIHALPARCRSVLRGHRVEKDLHDELSFHLAMQTQANLQRGLSEVEANRRARQALGGVEQVKERSRDARPLRWARDFVNDLGYTRRSFQRHPGFAVIAVVTLTLGIGANTAMFSVLNTFLFRPLPYQDSERLVELFSDVGVLAETALLGARPSAPALVLSRPLRWRPRQPRSGDRREPVAILGKSSPHRVEVAVADQPGDGPDLAGAHLPMVDLDDR